MKSMIKKVLSMMVCIVVFGTMLPVSASALEKGVYTASVVTSYYNPDTGKVDDGGTANAALGEGMCRSATGTTALVEYDGKNTWVTVRLLLQSNCKNVALYTRNGYNSYSKVNYTVMAEDAGELDLSGVEAAATLRVYKDEMLPAAVSVEISDAGSVVESDGTKMEIHSLSLELNYSEFDTIESIEIPEEALNSASAEQETAGMQKMADAQGKAEAQNDGDNADDLSGLQGLYGKAPEYEHMGIGYYFDGLEEDMIRDGYVPYEDNFVQRDMGSLTGVNHGVSIRLSMTRANSATEALAGLLEDYTKRLADKGLSILDSDTPSTDVDDTVGLLPAIYINDEGRQIFTVLYADIRDDGTVYMCAEMEFDENGFDDTTEALLAEIDDAYALDLSSIFIEE